MPTKSTTGRLAEKFLGGAIFPSLTLRPGAHSGLPFVGRNRVASGGALGQPPRPQIYGRMGQLEVRLACKKSEIRRAQRLRYKVFYQEMAATPDALTLLSRRDEDAYDPIFDHLLVLDHGDPAKKAWGRPKVVGTYRVLRQDIADMNEGFYTEGEYAIRPLLRSKPDCRFMELGRSCVLKPYRNRRTLELLWHGVWSYVRQHQGDVMIGCASFPGTDPSQHALALSFLHHTALAPTEWRVCAHDHLRVDMNMMPKEAVTMRTALKALPPLIKGYLRMGAYVGDGAVIDHQFGTTDVLIVMPVEQINTRYFAHFGAPDDLTSPIAPDAGSLN